MMKLIASVAVILMGVGRPLFPQEVETLTVGTKTSLRGLSVVDDKVVWASGSNGTVGRSLDGGQTWNWIIVKGFEKRDFRDIEAFDGASAIIMAVAEPAYILKTTNGGETWKVVYENKTPGMFLDGMEFWNEQSGIVMGDPVNGKFFIARTFDEGNSWREIPFVHRPSADSGEACFAASGTNIRELDRDEACFVSAGKRSRFFSKRNPVDLPIVQGKETTGANSIAVRLDKKLKTSNYLVVVGGDFADESNNEKNCFLSKDGGQTWVTPSVSPHGYRSSVEFISKEKLICCGPSGVDISIDAGINWRLISGDGYHVCRKAKKGKMIFLAGPEGKVGKLVVR